MWITRNLGTLTHLLGLESLGGNTHLSRKTICKATEPACIMEHKWEIPMEKVYPYSGKAIEIASLIAWVSDQFEPCQRPFEQEHPRAIHALQRFTGEETILGIAK